MTVPEQQARFCPFDVGDEFRRLRSADPVSRLPLPSGAQVWFVARNADGRQALADPRLRTVDAARLMRPGTGSDYDHFTPAPPGVFLFTDPPEHTRYRRLLTGEFTVRRMSQLRPRVEAIVADRLDALDEAGSPADLVSLFALPVPSLVICELLGVPYADRADFQRRTSAQVDLTMSEEQALALWAESAGYLAELVAAKRATPTDDLLGRLLAEHGHELSDAEVVGIGTFLLGAGYETTANMLALGTLALLRRPEQLTRLRDNADPGSVERAVEEVLRYLPVVNNSAIRQAKEDLTVAGRLIRAGELVMVSLGSANRDDDVYDASDEFDISRAPGSHLAFGHGIHHCLGAPLARLEMQVAYPALLRRFPRLRLAGSFDDIDYLPRSLVHGVRALPVALD